jgi:hypothetical protein
VVSEVTPPEPIVHPPPPLWRGFKASPADGAVALSVQAAAANKANAETIRAARRVMEDPVAD